MITNFYAGGGCQNAIDDHVNVCWWFKELMLCYKYGEKRQFKKAFDTIKPYLDDNLVRFFTEIYEDSLWLNPVTGKKGF